MTTNTEQHDHNHEEGERHVCPRMDGECRSGLKLILGTIIQDYLDAHGTALEEDKGNAEARTVLTEMLAELPSGADLREQIALAEANGGVMPEA